MRAFIERHRQGGTKAAGEKGDPGRVAEAQAMPGVGQGHEPPEDRQPHLEDLGVAHALGRAVVKEHHPLRDRHRPRRPGEDRLAGEELAQTEKP